MKIVSFGYLHGPPPAAHITVDLRDLFRDPHIDPEMRELTGLKQRVYDNVMAQPEAMRFVRLLGYTGRLLAEIKPGSVIAVGCAGGRHRSVAIVRALWVELSIGDRDVTCEHRDVEKPVVRRDGEQS